ncbi:hypothetical protein TNCV_4822351 [Trichonephila clavipes]|nr:hypothetical protein TNCV_4822351 [Trichonephila clavipes]
MSMKQTLLESFLWKKKRLSEETEMSSTSKIWPFTIGEELILPATKDICRELLGEAAVEKIEHVPLLADTVTTHIEEIAKDIQA